MDRRLYRSRRERVWTGVAGGVALWLNTDPSIIRVAWVILTFLTGGLALVVYIVMAIVVPEAPVRRGPAAVTEPAEPRAGSPAAGEPIGEATPTEVWEEEPMERRGDAGNGALIGGLILVGIGLFFLLREYLDLDWARFWPLVLIALGALLLFGSLSRRRE